jgi:hypothetical protein
LPARLETIRQACRESVFSQNPSACPKASVIGSAAVATPILNSPMKGSVLLVSKSHQASAHGASAFPDMILVLQGGGLRVNLTGALYVDKHNITSTTFRAIPDVPIRRLDIVLPEGKNSVLAASSVLCTKKPLIMSTAINAQDNARVRHTVRVSVEGCSHKRRQPARRKVKK